MTSFATARHLSAALFLFLLPALGHAQAIHDTGTAQLRVFANGYIGTTPPNFAETGFFFDGDPGLFHAAFVVGVDSTQVSGNLYGGATGQGPNEWVAQSGPTAFTPLIADFDQGFIATFGDSATPNSIGLEVTQRSYSGEDDAFVVLEYTIRNVSGGDLDSVFTGVFADWDVGGGDGIPPDPFERNFAGYDEDSRLLYAYDSTQTSTNYFGVTALTDNVSGISYIGEGGLDTDADIYSYLTMIDDDAVIDTTTDVRTTIGLGPYDIADGDSVVVRFAFVGGSDLDDAIASAEEAQAIDFSGAVDEAIHDTGLVQFEVYDDGNLGTEAAGPQNFPGTGFVFDDVNAGGNGGLFSSTFIVGQSPSQVSGMAYATGEWVTVDSLMVAAPPMDFDQAFLAGYDDSGASNPIGLEVEQYSYSSSDDDMNGFVVVEFEITNTSGSDLTGLYPGIFADWDAGAAVENLGGYDEDTRLLYVYDAASGTADPNYYGVAALDDNVSGYILDAGFGFNPTEENLYEALTTVFAIPDSLDDRRTVLGVGPYDIADGGSVTVRFAFVGGEDLEDITENACTAQGDEDCKDVATETTTPAGTFALHSAYPNPFASRTTLGFTLPEAQHVRLTVYDVLGRRVAQLADGPQAAGYSEVVFDASDLPSGVYVYRLETGSVELTERVSLVR